MVVSGLFTHLVPIQDFWRKINIFPLLIEALCVLNTTSVANNGLIVVCGRSALMLLPNVGKYFTKSYLSSCAWLMATSLSYYAKCSLCVFLQPTVEQQYDVIYSLR